MDRVIKDLMHYHCHRIVTMFLQWVLDKYGDQWVTYVITDQDKYIHEFLEEGFKDFRG